MDIAKPFRPLLLLALAGCTPTPPSHSTSAIAPAAAGAAPAAKPEARVVADSCADLDACVARMRYLASQKDDFDGLDPGEQALIARIITRDGATPKLVALLADPDECVAQLAAAA